MKNHYVYRITNKVENKHYYGCRTTKLEPKNDLGSKYFSSSKDKDFIKDQKENPDKYKYKVIKIFSTREEALKLEIKLHNKFNVGKNNSFYNKAKQSSTGYDTTGIKRYQTDETKMKISKANSGRKFSEEGRKNMSEAKAGKKLSEEHKESLRTPKINKQNMFGHKPGNETKEKMSEIRKKIWETIEKIVCPHCGLVGRGGSMVQWHFDKCRSKA